MALNGVSSGLPSPGSSNSSDADPVGLSTLPQAIGTLTASLGVPRLKVVAPPELVQAQLAAYPSGVSFLTALRGAIVSLLTDDSGYYSPLQTVCVDPLAFGVAPPRDFTSWSEEEKAPAREAVRVRMDREASVLELCSQETQFMPEYGEGIDEYWVFKLSLDDMRILQWAMVRRDGSRSAYNYGYD